MAREDVRIRRVPDALVLRPGRGTRSTASSSMASTSQRSADKDAPRWKVFDRKKADGEIDKDFKDVVLKFNPAGGLKFLAEYAMGITPKYHFGDVELDSEVTHRRNSAMPRLPWRSAGRMTAGPCP